MAMTLTIELPDELEQQVLAEAEQQQLPPERIIVQSVAELFQAKAALSTRTALLRAKKQPFTNQAELRASQPLAASTLETLLQLRNEVRY